MRKALLASLILAPIGVFSQRAEEPIPLPPVTANTKAETYEQAYMDAYDQTLGLPYPTKVVNPVLTNGRYAGETVELIFTVDAKGVPHQMGVLKGTSDFGLANLLMNAVSNWRFAPAKREGVAVPQRVTLELMMRGEGENKLREMYSMTAGGRSYPLN